MSTLTNLIQYSTEDLARKKWKERKKERKKKYKGGKGRNKMVLFSSDITGYMENLKEFIKSFVINKHI